MQGQARVVAGILISISCGCSNSRGRSCSKWNSKLGTQQQQQSQQSTGGYDQQFLEQQRQQMARIEQNRQSSSSTGQNQDHSLLQQQRQMAQIQQQRQNSRLPPQPPSFGGAPASNPSTSSAAFEQHWSGNRSNQNAAGGTEYQQQQSTLISMGFTDTAVRAFDCCCNFLICAFDRRMQLPCRRQMVMWPKRLIC